MLRGGSFDGQLRLIAAGSPLTMTVQHEVDGQAWVETYAHEGAIADVPTFGAVPGLVFRERRPAPPVLTSPDSLCEPAYPA